MSARSFRASAMPLLSLIRRRRTGVSGPRYRAGGRAPFRVSGCQYQYFRPLTVLIRAEPSASMISRKLPVQALSASSTWMVWSGTDIVGVP